MTGYLIAAAVGLVLAVTGGLMLQTWRVEALRTDLADTIVERDVARAGVELQRQARVRAERVLSAERDRAVAAERRVAELLAPIEKDAGTDRDAPPAPVLRDTMDRLRGAP